MNTLNIKNIIILLSILTGITATIIGFVKLDINDFTLNNSNEIIIFFSLIISIFLISVLFRINNFFLSIILLVIFSFWLDVITPVLSVIFFLFSSYYLGKFINSTLFQKSTADLTKLLIGIATYGLLTSIFVHFPINYTFLYIIVLSLPIIYFRNEINFNLVSSFLINLKNKKSNHFYLDFLIITIGFIYFFISLMPEIGHDALATHLFIPAYIEENKYWHFNVKYYVWAVGPKLGDWIITIPYLLGGETAARLFNTSSIFLICWLLTSVVKYIHNNELIQRGVVILFLSSPFTYGLGSTIFNEPIWSLFIVAFFYYFLKILYDNEYSLQNFSIAGILLGASLSIKAITLILLPIIIFISLFRLRRIISKEYLFIFTSLFLFVVIFSIKPYAISYIATGNPVFPFFNGFFKSELFDTAANFNNPVWGSGINWNLFYLITFNSYKFTEALIGGIGFHLLLLTLPAIIIFTLEKDLKVLFYIFIAISSIYITFEFTAYLRYTFPAQVLLILVSALILSRPKLDLFLKNLIKLAFAITIFLNLFFFDSGYGFKTINFDVIKYKNDHEREDFLITFSPQRVAVKEINKINDNKSPVAVFGGSSMAGIKSDVLYPSWYNPSFFSNILDVQSEIDMFDTLKAWDVEYILYDKKWQFHEHGKYIISITDKLESFGDHDLLKINELKYPNIQSESRDTDEIIKDNKFINMNNWNHVVENLYDGEGIISSNINPVSQMVRIEPNKIYKYSLVAKCFKDDVVSEGRLQISWLDKDGDYLATEIEIFSCLNDEEKYSMLLRSPYNAKYALVFATGHTDKSIIFKSVSLK